jgi:hypothetical protein
MEISKFFKNHKPKLGGIEILRHNSKSEHSTSMDNTCANSPYVKSKSYGKIQNQQIRIDNTLDNIFDSFFSKCHVALKYQK